jgi:DNA repair protein RadA/Sms
VSSLAGAPLPADAVYFGEISLSGAVRPVAQTAARLKEAQKLGFTRAIVPEAARSEGSGDQELQLRFIGRLANLAAEIIASRTSDDPPRPSDQRRQMAGDEAVRSGYTPLAPRVR